MFFGFYIVSYCFALCVERAGSFLATTILGLATRLTEVMKFCRSMVQISFQVKSTITHLVMLFPRFGASSILLLFCSPRPALLWFQDLEWVRSSHNQVMAVALSGEARVSVLFSILRIFLSLNSPCHALSLTPLANGCYGFLFVGTFSRFSGAIHCCYGVSALLDLPPKSRVSGLSPV